jgi:hypothetical protein
MKTTTYNCGSSREIISCKPSISKERKREHVKVKILHFTIDISMYREQQRS